MRSTQNLEETFSSYPDGIIISDQEDKITRTNATALRLFHVPSEHMIVGMDYQQFFQRYDIRDEWRQPIASEYWLNNLACDEPENKSEQTIILRISPKKQVYINVECACITNAQQDVVGMVSVFHVIPERYQQAFHLQKVYMTVSRLKEAIANLPEYTQLSLPETKLFLTPPVLSITQQLVDVIHEVVNCDRVTVLALKPPQHYVYYVAGNGWTPEQEQYLREIGGRRLSSELLDEASFARLLNDEQVIISSDDLLKPLPFSLKPEPQNIHLTPLFLEGQLIGVVSLDKTHGEGSYTSDELELVKVITAEVMLLIECINSLHMLTTTQAQRFMMQEVHHLTNDFLTMASHELFTPLTGIIGNLQLAQRRLKKLKRVAPEEGQSMHAHIEHIEQSLAAANESAYQQQRIINNLIDDMRIKTNSLLLSRKLCDLRALLKDAVIKQRTYSPGYIIMLEDESAEQPVLVNIDAGRISQVITTYLEAALKLTSPQQPVIVGLAVVQNVARVFVMEDESAIPQEEQQHLWERFSYAKGSQICSELDLHLGLSFYLCQELIKRHGGTVGVKSVPGYGAKFWFALPLALPSKE